MTERRGQADESKIPDGQIPTAGGRDSAAALADRTPDSKKRIPAGVPNELVSIIVPTYCEAENLEPLCEDLHRVMRDHEILYEVLVADDQSPDGTAATCARLGARYPYTPGPVGWPRP